MKDYSLSLIFCWIYAIILIGNGQSDISLIFVFLGMCPIINLILAVGGGFCAIAYSILILAEKIGVLI